MIGCFGNGHGPCVGRIQVHHVIKQQTIRSRLKTLAYEQGWSKRKLAEEIITALGDPRNHAKICDLHHQRLHNARYRIPRANLPDSVEEFARDYGLLASLERDYEAAA